MMKLDDLLKKLENALYSTFKFICLYHKFWLIVWYVEKVHKVHFFKGATAKPIAPA